MNLFYAVSGRPFTDQHGNTAVPAKGPSETDSSNASTVISDPAPESPAAPVVIVNTTAVVVTGSEKHAQHSACCGGYAQRCREGKTEAGLALTKFPSASFDTVVDTFGLCSHEDPVLVGEILWGILQDRYCPGSLSLKDTCNNAAHMHSSVS